MSIDNKRVKLSKFLSLVLRHKPDIIGIKLRKDGFVDLHELLTKIKKRKGFGWVSLADIKELVKNDPKKRFEIRMIKGREFIRAIYGHNKNLGVAIKYDEIKPGEVKVLFHGTNADVLPWILKEGLKPMARKYVHLSVSPEDAISVAKRRKGKAVILRIDVEEFLKDGGEIYKASDRIYLAKKIPPKYIHIHKYGVE